MNETFPQLLTIATQLLASPPSGPSQDVPTILHFILKAYRGSIILQLSKHQQSQESLIPWANLLFQVIKLQIPSGAVPEAEDEREKSAWRYQGYNQDESCGEDCLMIQSHSYSPFFVCTVSSVIPWSNLEVLE